MQQLCFGRTSELDELCNWVESDAPLRAALLIGPAGIGKTAVLRHFESHCRNHHTPAWYVQRFDLTERDSADQFIERLLLDTQSIYVGEGFFVSANDLRLIEAIPKLGPVLAQLLGSNKPPRQKLQKYLDHIT